MYDKLSNQTLKCTQIPAPYLIKVRGKTAFIIKRILLNKKYWIR